MNKKNVKSNITGVILSGGKSKRMELNKSFLKVDNNFLIEHIYNIISSVFEKIIISTNEPELYDFMNVEKIEDLIKGFGPLSGIHSALTFAKTEKIFVVPCDMPFIIPDIIKYLISIDTSEGIVLPTANGQIQYLFGIYNKQILKLAEEILLANYSAKLKSKGFKKSAVSLWNFVDRVGAEIVDVEEKIFYMKDLFFNINTPKDWEYAIERII
jgi:molybdopterin-guanine dinucleotide biosynthesis protein A